MITAVIERLSLHAGSVPKSLLLLLRRPTYFCWHRTLMASRGEKWHPGVSKITSSLLWCLLLFFFYQLWLRCFVLGWEFVCEPFSFGLFLPWWYEQFIKIVLKEILRCVPSDVGHLLYSTGPRGAEITSISSCKLETLHVIQVFRYIISFSVFMNICAQWDLA